MWRDNKLSKINTGKVDGFVKLIKRKFGSPMRAYKEVQSLERAGEVSLASVCSDIVRRLCDQDLVSCSARNGLGFMRTQR